MSGEMIAKILEGAKAEDIPIASVKEPMLTVNGPLALGLTVPDRSGPRDDVKTGRKHREIVAVDFLLSNIGQGLICTPRWYSRCISLFHWIPRPFGGRYVPLGAAVTVCLLAGVDPIVALLLAMLAGALAGFITGALRLP